MSSNKRGYRPALASARLKKSIAAYREAHGERVKGVDQKALRNLAADRVAVRAFAAFDVDDRRQALLIDACVQTRVLARDFKLWSEEERRVPSRMDKLDQAIASLQAFTIELSGGPRNILAAQVHHAPTYWATMQRALRLISDDVAARRRIAHETLLRIGATRKLADVAETKAIGWLAKSIHRITGKSHAKHVAELATIVLELKEPCSSARVIKARKVLDREWRQPLVSPRELHGPGRRP